MDKKEMFKNMLQIADGTGLFPPPATKHLDIEFIEYEEGHFLKHKAPIKESYYNPGGVVFGGYYGMFFDAAFGPFSFLESETYCASLDMNICFLQPLSIADKEIIVTANLLNKSKSFLIMDAKAHKLDGTLVATATTRMIVLDQSRKK